MATGSSEFKDVSDIAKEIVVSSSDSESSDNEINECDSFFLIRTLVKMKPPMWSMEVKLLVNCHHCQ